LLNQGLYALRTKYRAATRAVDVGGDRFVAQKAVIHEFAPRKRLRAQQPADNPFPNGCPDADVFGPAGEKITASFMVPSRAVKCDESDLNSSCGPYTLRPLAN
jgi:hypothetical protein